MRSVNAGLPVSALADTWVGWLTYRSSSPGEQFELSCQAWENMRRVAELALSGLARSPSDVEPGTPHRRCTSGAWPHWSYWQYDPIVQGFLFNSSWWLAATTGVRTTTPQCAGPRGVRD